MRLLPRHIKLLPALMAVALLSTSRLAAAGPIAPTPFFGSYSALVNGVTMITGTIGVLGDGALYFGSPFDYLTPDHLARLTVTNISGNADPAIIFGVSASNLGDVAQSFQFVFGIPISLSGPLFAHSALSYGVGTATTAAASVTPTLARILTAANSDTTAGGLGELNLGLDLGPALSVAGPGSSFSGGPLVATSFPTGDPAYDFMVVRLGFSLTPHTDASFGGFVEETMFATTAVPEPASFALLASGLAGLIVRRTIKRRRI